LNKFLTVNYNKCTGCRLCEIACAWNNEGVTNTEMSRIKVYSYYPGIDIPMFCMKCSDVPCVASCPAEALYRNENGCIIVEYDKCTGCGICVDNCRACVISLHPSRNTPLICHHCEGTEPECVKVCPTNALEFVPVPSDGKYLAEKREELYKELNKTLEEGSRKLTGN